MARPRFATVTDDAGSVVAATLRTPPHNQVLSCVDELEAVDALVDALRARTCPALLGPTEPAARFAARWTDATGQPARRPGRRTHLPPRTRDPSRIARRRAGGGWWGHETAS